MTQDSDYIIRGIPLGNVRNRNEVRVVNALTEMVADKAGFCACRVCTEDVFALALNRLPPHYVQRASILLRNKGVSDREIREAVEAAMEQIGLHPNHESLTG